MSILGVIGKVRPDEIYNLAAQSHVQVSFDSPEFTADVDAVGVLRVLEAVRQLGLTENCRIYQASTSELYGKVEEVPQNENTPFHPYSPYAVAKQYGFWIVKEYREAYNMFCCSGILFNHESERRGETFVTRKITLAAARIAQGKQDCLYLGNLDSLRDWGYAKDYVECMWLILQHDTPEDFVIATGVQHTVREFATLAFQYAGIELRWEGEGINEKGYAVNLYGDPADGNGGLWEFAMLQAADGAADAKAKLNAIKAHLANAKTYATAEAKAPGLYGATEKQELEDLIKNVDPEANCHQARSRAVNRL